MRENEKWKDWEKELLGGAHFIGGEPKQNGVGTKEAFVFVFGGLA